MLLSESSRYMSYFEEMRGIKFKKIKETTPFGSIDIFVEKRIIFINNMGLDSGNGNRNTPLAVAFILEKYKVASLGMVSKVGGINKLLNVGDVLIFDDYIDVTNNRSKSYQNEITPKLKIRYSMETPFCQTWRDRFISMYIESKNHYRNFFDNGVYICTEGPGFESNAEIYDFRQRQADAVGHWIVPYVYYARELEVCFLSIGVVSNIYHKKTKNMPDTKENNILFGNLYSYLYDSYCKEDCQSQQSHMIQKEMY